MADFSKLYEAAPGLEALGEAKVGAIWREFMNSYEQKDLMPLMVQAQTPESLRKIQDRFSTWWMKKTEYAESTGQLMSGF